MKQKKRPKEITKAGLSSYWDHCQEIISSEKRGNSRKTNRRLQMAEGVTQVLKDMVYKPQGGKNRATP